MNIEFSRYGLALSQPKVFASGWTPGVINIYYVLQLDKVITYSLQVSLEPSSLGFLEYCYSVQQLKIPIVIIHETRVQVQAGYLGEKSLRNTIVGEF